MLQTFWPNLNQYNVVIPVPAAQCNELPEAEDTPAATASWIWSSNCIILFLAELFQSNSSKNLDSCHRMSTKSLWTFFTPHLCSASFVASRCMKRKVPPSQNVVFKKRRNKTFMLQCRNVTVEKKLLNPIPSGDLIVIIPCLFKCSNLLRTQSQSSHLVCHHSQGSGQRHNTWDEAAADWTWDTQMLGVSPAQDKLTSQLCCCCQGFPHLPIPTDLTLSWNTRVQ